MTKDELAAVYLLGYSDGEQAGHRAAHEEMAKEWAAFVAAPVRNLGKSSSLPHEELQRRRAKPGGIVYEARLARHGREYEGGPVVWETGQPVRESAA
jgi:hypothetical protein